jgi:alkanesulfonate monooxygenase SsuD/methylene tetrahydromethanopterin reductase-like flavin-dependent oxidoreductase (luciferase family)
MTPIEVHLRYDLRAPEWGTPHAALYQAALEQCAWADEHGLDAVLISEHHASDDGYLPSPMVFAAAVAARTKRIRVRIAALALPLHDPVRAAEDLTVLDIISGGRLDVVVAAGYVPGEFAMFGVPYEGRGARLAAAVKVMRALWRGEQATWEGRTARVRPLPLQAGGPPLIFAGASDISARRAARLGDGYMPVHPKLYKRYVEECARLDKAPSGPAPSTGPAFLHLSDDPEAAWATIAPHALHEVNAYAAWLAEAGVPGPYSACRTVDDVRATGLYQVMTPEACVTAITEQKIRGSVVFHPLMGGLDPQVANASLQLLAERVLPAIRE